MKNVFFFDLDGTLTDSSLGITKSVSYALQAFDIQVDDLTTLYPFIGPPLPESFSRFYGFSSEQAQKATAKYREYYTVDGKFENKVYDGIDALLLELNRLEARVFVATSKPTELAVEILNHFNLSQYFEFIGGSAPDDGRYKKTEVIAWLLDKYGFNRNEVVMIGDHMDDVRGAKDNGIESVGVLYGFGEAKDIISAGADYTVGTVDELKTLLLKLADAL